MDLERVLFPSVSDEEIKEKLEMKSKQSLTSEQINLLIQNLGGSDLYHLKSFFRDHKNLKGVYSSLCLCTLKKSKNLFQISQIEKLDHFISNKSTIKLSSQLFHNPTNEVNETTKKIAHLIFSEFSNSETKEIEIEKFIKANSNLNDIRKEISYLCEKSILSVSSNNEKIMPAYRFLVSQYKKSKESFL